MIIRLSANGGGELPFDGALPLGGELPFSFAAPCDELDISSSEVRFSGDVKVVGKLISLGEDYLLQGRIFATENFLCDRCLKDVQKDIEIDFAEKFSRVDDEDATLFTGDEIDLTDVVRDNLLAGESIRHLCKDDCKGLCKICGKDLNEGECSCDKFIIDPRFSILQDYRIDD